MSKGKQEPDSRARNHKGEVELEEWCWVNSLSQKGLEMRRCHFLF